jgi:hypothetical protein
LLHSVCTSFLVPMFYYSIDWRSVERNPWMHGRSRLSARRRRALPGTPTPWGAGVLARRRAGGAVGCAGVPARRRAGGARSQALPPYRGRFFGEAPARHLPFQASRRPNAPSPLVGEGGRGDEGQQGGNAAHRALLLRTLPLRRHDHLAGVRASPPAGAPEARAPRHCHLTGAGFLGKPLRAIFRFRHQDAQTPPSPLV